MGRRANKEKKKYGGKKEYVKHGKNDGKNERQKLNAQRIKY
jgi:hypothetical protein